MLYAPTDGGTSDDPSYHFGEDHCCLSSDRSILAVSDTRQIVILGIISRTLLFGFPDVHRARLKSLWVDQLVDTSRWRKHVSETVEDLRQTMSWVRPIATAVASLLTFYSKILTLFM